MYNLVQVVFCFLSFLCVDIELMLAYPFLAKINDRSFTKTLFKSGGICKRWLCVLLWMENILKTEVFENDDGLIMM